MTQSKIKYVVPELWLCSSWRGRARAQQPWRSHSRRTPAPYSRDKSVKETSEQHQQEAKLENKKTSELQPTGDQNQKAKDINPRSTARNAPRRRPKPAPPRDRRPEPSRVSTTTSRSIVFKTKPPASDATPGVN